LRVDAHVSVRTAGSDVLGTRCEIKNVNSLRSLGRAIDYEVARQIDLIGAGDRVHQETRHWDEAQGRTRSGRSKEEAEDYRYFQEPDLVPVEPTADQVSAIDRAMPPLPAARRATLREILPSSEPTTLALLVERGLDDLARAAVDAGAPAGLLAKRLEHDLAVDGADTLDPVALAELIGMEDSSALTATQAKQVLAEMVASGRSPAVIAADLGFESMDTAELEGVLDGIIRANPDEWDGYVGGDDKRRGKLTGFFVGQVMKATKGQADGQAVTRLLESRRTS
jgi:aspartyl-tRNA(Asn)/glutamyl-tRNA(Gln) amidotransferase subunit B